MSRSQMRYHPQVGFIYMPSARMRVPGAQGGYLVQTNAAGFRSDREFVARRSPGTFRVMLFGDSQTAGDGGANATRYSDLLEKAVPGLEVFNYGLSGSGTDQQFLAYEACASGIEHDLLVIAVYVENIRRVNRRVIKSRDANGEEALYAKPYYQIDGDGLVLHNVPVPKRPWTEKTLPPELLPHVYSYSETNFFSRKDRPPPAEDAAAPRTPLAPLRRVLKDLAMRVASFQPLPDYDSPGNPAWVLLRRILETWLRASRTPVLLLPLPHHVYLAAGSDPGGYQARFQELAQATGCHLYDPLPDIWKFSAEERRSFWCDAAGHLSSRGHEMLAGLLEPVVGRLMHSATAEVAPSHAV